MSGTAITYYALADGALDPLVMRRAFAALAEHNPVLCGSITVEGEQFVLRRGRPRPLPFSVAAGDPGQWFAGWSQAVDQTRDLARLDVVTDDHRTAVGLTVHHAIADGRAGFALLGELWSAYTELLSDRHLDRAVRAFPRSLETAIPSVAGQPADPPDLAAFTDLPRSPLTGAASVQGQFAIELTTAQTAALRDDARSQGVSVHGLLSGATLAAERSLIEGDGPELLLTSSAVDLRASLPKPMAPLDGTNIIAVIPDAIVVDPSTPPAEVGRAVVDRINAERTSATVLSRSLLAPIDLNLLLAAPPMSFITNVGRVSAMATPPGVEITDLRFAFPNQVTKSLTYVVTGWQDRLRIDVLHPLLGLPPTRAEELRAALATLLGAGPTGSAQPPVQA
ncbi:hypothetical protein ABQE69_13180 [Mycolicibacillus trivialis]|nr:hypothetical protein [Mycolicibacillus trivialis]